MDWLSLAAPVAAVGTGLMAGLFFVFSVAVMRGFRQLTPEVGIAAMQSINRSILNPVFGVVFFGTAVFCTAVLLQGIGQWPASGGILRVLGSAAYLAGGLAVTLFCNVPRNERLAALEKKDPEREAVWRSYLAEWTAWNHVRSAACLLAAAALTASIGT